MSSQRSNADESIDEQLPNTAHHFVQKKRKANENLQELKLMKQMVEENKSQVSEKIEINLRGPKRYSAAKKTKAIELAEVLGPHQVA